ncbi:MAG: DUF883 family protein [Alphaproteobacteria bacterium]|nr:DUF883 family protein [Alphaproteobacteria bacterium]
MTMTYNAPNGRDKVREAIASATNDATAVRHDLTHLASAIGEEVKARASTFSDMSKVRARRALEQTNKAIRRRPAAALGIAAGAGVVLGLLLAGRR